MIEMVEWLDLAKRFDGKVKVADLDPRESPNWCKHGFVLAFTFMMVQNISFESAIRQTIILGGDTHANCMIVGAMIGGMLGVQWIPDKMQQTLLSSNQENWAEKERPLVLQPANSFMGCFEKLMTKASTSIVVDMRQRVIDDKIVDQGLDLTQKEEESKESTPAKSDEEQMIETKLILQQQEIAPEGQQ